MARVSVSEGLLEGELVHNEYGGTFYSFKGIPYAQPPVGDLRFKAPLPPTSWEGVRSAKRFGSKCFQMDLLTKSVIGSEDCLYLNVYSPNIKPDKPLPVMFWIHGGGMTFGSGEDDFYGPEFLVRQGVILVTINYRLEVLGFLCLDTEDVPGNAGLKDQVEALRWVNKNICNFGGDPNNITIFGESAGSASVTYHLVSPMTKGLFKRAIAQSGVWYCPWARVYKPRERALALARQLGFFSEDDKELYNFYKNQSPKPFIATHVPVLLSEKSISGVAYFGVVDEKKFDNNERFFSKEFSSIHEDAEIMIGYTTDEGLIFMAQGDTPKANLEIARDFPEIFVPKFLAVDLTVNQQLEVGKKIKNFYFKDKIEISNDWEQLTKLYAAANLAYNIYQFTNVCAKTNKVYLYSFSCKSEINMFSNLLGLKDIIQNKPVTCHGDDLFYLFNFKVMPDKIESSSKTFELVDKVTKLWTNFAKYGNPTPDESLEAKWEQYTVEKENYLDIGNEFVAKTALDAEDVKFWDDIYKEYGQKLK